jgi:hypothetical protein
MNQISPLQRTCSGLLIDFAKPMQMLQQHLTYKLVLRYNYIPDFSVPLQIDSGH